MSEERDIVVRLVQALRRIEAKAEGALLHAGNLHKVLEDIRDAAGSAAAEAAQQMKMPPYDTQ
jgi:hypothetical protein